MYAIFTADNEIQEIEIRGYRFACIFRSEKEANKVVDALAYGPEYEIKKVKVL